MYRKALFASDGSKFSKAALAHVATVTEEEAIVVAVIDSAGSIVARTTPSELSADLAGQMVAAERGAATLYTDEAAQALREAGVANVRTMVREGQPGREIVSTAAEEGCDVIVMGTHGRTGLARAILGSVADYVVHHAKHVAVLLVHPSDDELAAD